MNSEEASLIASQPFIQRFVLSIIHNIRARNFAYEERQVIHAEMVPRVSEKVMQASLTEHMTPSIDVLPAPIAPPIVPKKKIVEPVARSLPKRDMGALVAPMPRSRTGIRDSGLGIRKAKMAPMPQIQMQAPASAQIQSMAQVPAAPQGAKLSQDYGKITPLLNDPSVSSIECSGAGRAITIIRAGQKQMTKITLNISDIKEILQKVSDAVHVPLLEGVFRAAVDNFSINAVISEMIGSRFVIKKQTPYALFEGKA